MALTDEQVNLLKNKLQEAFKKNTKLMEEFGINNPTQIKNWPGHEIEKHLNTRVLGMIGLSKKDLGML